MHVKQMLRHLSEEGSRPRWREHLVVAQFETETCWSDSKGGESSDSRNAPHTFRAHEHSSHLPNAIRKPDGMRRKSSLVQDVDSETIFSVSDCSEPGRVRRRRRRWWCCNRWYTRIWWKEIQTRRPPDRRIALLRYWPLLEWKCGGVIFTILVCGTSGTWQSGEMETRVEFLVQH